MAVVHTECKWTIEEEQYLRNNYLQAGCKMCAEYLGRTYFSVSGKAINLGLKTQIPYTQTEIAYIKANYAAKGAQIIAQELHRSIPSITYIARIKFGIKMSEHGRTKIAKKIRARWTNESRKKKSISQSKKRGPLNGSWKGGISSLEVIVRGRLTAVWKQPIFRRDNYTCQICQERGGKLVAHHIRLFTEIRDAVIKQHPELSILNYKDKDKLADLIVAAHKLNDGVTLCRKCHDKHHLENGVNCGDIFAGIKDNPQPRLDGNILQGSETNSRSLTDYAEGSNGDTSALDVVFLQRYEIVRACETIARTEV
jgi:hypothetical protein